MSKRTATSATTAARFRREVSPNERLYLAGARIAGPFAIQLFVDGAGEVDVARLTAAVATASAVYPGARLVLDGKQWIDSGVAPPVTMIEGDTGPDEESARWRQPLDVQSGPTCEVVVVRRAMRTTVIFRAFHGVMDGKGALIWAHAVWRAYRGEPAHAATGATNSAQSANATGDARSADSAATVPPSAQAGAPDARSGHAAATDARSAPAAAIDARSARAPATDQRSACAAATDQRSAHDSATDARSAPAAATDARSARAAAPDQRSAHAAAPDQRSAHAAAPDNHSVDSAARDARSAHAALSDPGSVDGAATDPRSAHAGASSAPSTNSAESSAGLTVGAVKSARFPDRTASSARFPDGTATSARFPDRTATSARFPDGSATSARFPDRTATSARFPDRRASSARYVEGTASSERSANVDASDAPSDADTGHAATSVATDRSLLAQLGARHRRARPAFDCPSPLGTTAAHAADTFVWKRRTLAGAQPGLVAKLAATVAASAPAETRLRFMVPVDIRRHAPALVATSNLSLPIFLDAQPNETWEALYEQLLAALADKRELAVDGSEGALAAMPIWTMTAVIKASLRLRRRGHFAATAILSHLGRVDPRALSGGDFRATTVYSLPVHVPLAAMSLVAVDCGGHVEVTLVCPADVATAADALLDRIVAAVAQSTATDHAATRGAHESGEYQHILSSEQPRDESPERRSTSTQARQSVPGSQHHRTSEHRPAGMPRLQGLAATDHERAVVSAYQYTGTPAAQRTGVPPRQRTTTPHSHSPAATEGQRAAAPASPRASASEDLRTSPQSHLIASAPADLRASARPNLRASHADQRGVAPSHLCDSASEAQSVDATPQLLASASENLHTSVPAHLRASASEDLRAAVPAHLLASASDDLPAAAPSHQLTAAPESRHLSAPEYEHAGASDLGDIVPLAAPATGFASPANDTASIPSRTIAGLFADEVARTPDAVALVCDEARVTYAALAQRSDAIAAGLQARGLGAGAIIGLLVDREPAAIVMMLGILKAGAAYLPLDPQYPAERLGWLLADAKAALCLTTRAHAARLDGVFAGPVAIADELAAAPGDGATFAPVAEDPRSLAYVLYTSGSTGRPKGVLIEQRSLVNYVAWAQAAYAIDASTRFALFTSLSFDLTATAIFPPLLAGGSIALVPESLDHLTLRKILRDCGANALKLTPTHLSLITQLDGAAPRGFRVLVVGGEQLTTSLARKAQARFGDGCRIVNEYGPTEATIGCVWHVFDAARDSDAAAVPIGVPGYNMEAHLLDGERRPVAPGASGELYLAGACLARGYLDRPDLNRERFVSLPDGRRAYRTGDVARLNERGLLEFLGRADEQVKIRGHRIEPGEIEALLAAQPGVAQARVVGRARAAGGEPVLCAYYVPAASVRALVGARDSEDAHVDEACGAAVDHAGSARAGGASPAHARVDEVALRRALERQLPAFMIPAYIIAVDEIPLTVNGKADLRRLPSPADNDDNGTHSDAVAADTGAVAPPHPSDALTTAVAAIWAELLGVDAANIGPESDFHALGGDSLQLVQLFAAIGDRVVGAELEPRFMQHIRPILRRPTLAGVCAVIRDVRCAADGPTTRDLRSPADGPTTRDLRAAADGPTTRDVHGAAAGSTTQDVRSASDGPTTRDLREPTP